MALLREVLQRKTKKRIWRSLPNTIGVGWRGGTFKGHGDYEKETEGRLTGSETDRQTGKSSIASPPPPPSG